MSRRLRVTLGSIAALLLLASLAFIFVGIWSEQGSEFASNAGTSGGVLLFLAFAIGLAANFPD